MAEVRLALIILFAVSTFRGLRLREAFIFRRLRVVHTFSIMAVASQAFVIIVACVTLSQEALVL